MAPLTPCAALHGVSMGTTWSIHYLAPGQDTGRLQAAVQAALDKIVAQMSTWDPDSAISRLNRADTGWYQVAPEFFNVLTHALELAACTDGAYDPTLGALVDLWGFGPAGSVAQPPSAEAVQQALACGGWRRTALNTAHRGVWQPGGLQFDLSSIAKGYGVDEIARVLRDAGIKHFLAELGGELAACGRNPSGLPWRVVIEAPDASNEKIPVNLHNAAIATSGSYRRHFHHEGRRYAHTIDPRSGAPLPDDLLSVSVIHEQCMMADAMATALLSLGPKRGLEHARRHKLAALFMAQQDAGVAVEWTPEFAALAGALTQ